MSTLRTVALVLLVVGLIGLFIPTFPAAAVLKWFIALALIIFVADMVTGRKRV